MKEQVNKLHLGCGLNTPDGWINLDSSWNARLKNPFLRKVVKFLRLLSPSQLDIPWNPDILIHDVRKPLPFQDSSLEAIYASHLLEHLYLEEATCLLRECFRILMPGSTLRMVVPDLRAIVLEYMAANSSDSSAIEEVTPADILNKKLLLRPTKSASGNFFYRIYKISHDFHFHKWMYDSHSLITYFKEAGFIDVQERPLHQSRIQGIEVIEKVDRVINGSGICVEGIKS